MPQPDDKRNLGCDTQADSSIQPLDVMISIEYSLFELDPRVSKCRCVIRGVQEEAPSLIRPK